MKKIVTLRKTGQIVTIVDVFNNGFKVKYIVNNEPGNWGICDVSELDYFDPNKFEEFMKSIKQRCMKAKIKGTGQVLNVEGIYLENGYNYELDEVELIFEGSFSKLPIDWEARRFQLVMAAMQGVLASWNVGIPTSNAVVRQSFEYADAVLAEYRKGGEE